MEYMDPDNPPYWKWPKDPADQRNYGIEFAGVLKPGDSIAEIISVTPFPDTLTIGAFTTLPGNGGPNTLVGLFATGGVASIDYKISALVVSVLGERLNRSGILKVRNK
jgi:hypothetical protein